LDDAVGCGDAVVRRLGLGGLLDRIVAEDAEQARRVAQGSEFDLDGFVVVRRERGQVELVGERAGFENWLFVVVFHPTSLISRLHAEQLASLGLSISISSTQAAEPAMSVMLSRLWLFCSRAHLSMIMQIPQSAGVSGSRSLCAKMALIAPTVRAKCVWGSP
jgi:hypothetical protein